MRVELKKARVYVHACASSGIRQTFRVNRKNGPKKAFFFYFGIFSVGEAVSNAWVLFFPFSLSFVFWWQNSVFSQ